jgi:hypothetical protein
MIFFVFIVHLRRFRYAFEIVLCINLINFFKTLPDNLFFFYLLINFTLFYVITFFKFTSIFILSANHFNIFISTHTQSDLLFCHALTKTILI